MIKQFYFKQINLALVSSVWLIDRTLQVLEWR